MFQKLNQGTEKSTVTGIEEGESDRRGNLKETVTNIHPKEGLECPLFSRTP